MIFAVLDVSLTMGLNIGETDKVFFALILIIANLTPQQEIAILFVS